MSEPQQGEADQNRRSQLLGLKLNALVADHLGVDVAGATETFPNGAALLRDGSAWVLIDGDAARSLGPALTWAVRRSASSLHVIADNHTGTLARRAVGFGLPTSIWFAEGRLLLPAIVEELAVASPVPPEHDALRSLITAAGAQPNVEHGVLSGEVRGLEVCRVVDRPTVGFFAEFGEFVAEGAEAAADEGVRLEVGVGAADREAFQLLHGEIPQLEALASVVGTVERFRRSDSPHHPLNRLGVERFLRWTAEQQPELVGCTSVTASEPPVPRPNLKDPTPCVAVGTDLKGGARRVVFTSGVDLDVLPFVVDVQSMGPEPVILAMPERDLLPVVREVALHLVAAVELVGLSPIG